VTAAVMEAIVVPTPTSERPPWIPADTWERMPWAARMRAARRVLHVVRPPETDDGAVSELAPDPTVIAERPDPSSPEPTYPCAIGCGRWTTLVYCDPCAALHETAPVTPPPAWLVAAHANRRSLNWQARRYGGHVCHAVAHRGSPRRPRPVTS